MYQSRIDYSVKEKMIYHRLLSFRESQGNCCLGIIGFSSFVNVVRGDKITVLNYLGQVFCS